MSGAASAVQLLRSAARSRDNQLGVLAVLASKQHYVVDEAGNRVGVYLDIAEYQRLLEELEELDSIRAERCGQGFPGEALPVRPGGRGD